MNFNLLRNITLFWSNPVGMKEGTIQRKTPLPYISTVRDWACDTILIHQHNVNLVRTQVSLLIIYICVHVGSCVHNKD